MLTFDHLKTIITAEDWEEIEGARGPSVSAHVAALIALYDKLDSWPQKLAVIQLLQDQEDTDEAKRVMLDVLRAPDVHDWFQDTVELTKAAALGFLDEEHDNFMAFYNDRTRLHQTIEQVLSAHGLTPVASSPRPPTAQPPSAETLMEAVAVGDLNSVRAFAAAGEDLDAPGKEGMPPIILALCNDQLEAVHLLIELGADPNVVREGGQTALSWAVFKGLTELVLKLIELGGDLQQTDRWGETLVKPAAQYGYDEILDALIEHGAPIDGALGDGRTAMWFAAESGKTASVLRLLVAGCPVNQLDSGSAPLHLAARNGSSRLVTALIKAGAEVDLPNDSGRTPLMLASSGGHANLVKKLLKAGADASLTDGNGKTAVELATGRRADDVRAAFESA